MFIFTSGLLLIITADVVQSRGYLYRSGIDGWLKQHKVIATWAEAFETCRREGAELATPLTEALLEEMVYLMSVKSHTARYFINAKARYRPGIYVTEEGDLLEDMPAVDLIDFLDSEDGECISMNKHSIRAVSCDSRLPYMCYRMRDNTTMTECGTYDTQYKKHGSSCYKYHSVNRSWLDAYATCINEGGHLLILDDGKEHLTIHNHVKFHGYQAIVGLRDKNGDGNWISIHGDPVDQLYNLWSDRLEPPPASLQYRCAAIYEESATLRAIDCTLKTHFICEKDPDKIMFPYTI